MRSRGDSRTKKSGTGSKSAPRQKSKRKQSSSLNQVRKSCLSKQFQSGQNGETALSPTEEKKDDLGSKAMELAVVQQTAIILNSESTPSNWQMHCEQLVGDSAENLKKSAKKVPKKRKFHLTDLELGEPQKTANNSVSSTLMSNADANISVSPIVGNGIDFQEWKGHRVLAKCDGLYLSGVIKDVQNRHDIHVLFDRDQSVRVFSDVFDSENTWIVSDHSPSPGQVEVGTCVCVRVNTEKNIFVRGVVVGLSGKPVQYNVKLDETVRLSQAGSDFYVSRANLRLLLPPWWEELELQQDSTQDAIPPPMLTPERLSSVATQQQSPYPPQAELIRSMPGSIFAQVVSQAPAFRPLTSPVPAIRMTSVQLTPTLGSAVFAVENKLLLTEGLAKKKIPRSPHQEENSSEDDLREENIRFEAEYSSTQRLSSVSQGSLTPLSRKVEAGPSSGSTASSEHISRSPALAAQKYKKGDIVSTPNGIRKKFNGKQWRRLCSKEGCTKESQRRGYCSRHLSLKGKSLRPPALSFLGGHRKGTFTTSSSGREIEWEDQSSRESESSPILLSERRLQGKFNVEETEAANMLVSLGNSRSTTPAFSPVHTPVSPAKSQNHSPLQASGNRTNFFTPIGQATVQPLTLIQPTTLQWNSEPLVDQKRSLATLVTTPSSPMAHFPKTPTQTAPSYQACPPTLRPDVIRSRVPESRTSVLHLTGSSQCETVSVIQTAGVIVPQPIHAQPQMVSKSDYHCGYEKSNHLSSSVGYLKKEAVEDTAASSSLMSRHPADGAIFHGAWPSVSGTPDISEEGFQSSSYIDSQKPERKMSYHEEPQEVEASHPAPTHLLPVMPVFPNADEEEVFHENRKHTSG